MRADGLDILDIDVVHGSMVLYARDGHVTGSLPLGGGMRWQDGSFEILKRSAPDVRGLEGKALKAILSHDYFSSDATVESSREHGDRVYLRVKDRPVNLTLSQDDPE